MKAKRRNSIGRPIHCHSPFSTRLVCGEYGGVYGTKTWRTTENGQCTRRLIWQCNEKYRMKGKVTSPDRYIADYEPIIEMLTDTSQLEFKAAALREQQEELYTLVKNCIDEKARRGCDPALDERHNKLIHRYDSIKQRLDDIAAEIDARSVSAPKLLRSLRKSPRRVKF